MSINHGATINQNAADYWSTADGTPVEVIETRAKLIEIVVPA